jgi:hypothetical protein
MEEIKRYEIKSNSASPIIESNIGKYVKYDDIKHLLNQPNESECKHNNITHHIDNNCFPYGDTCAYDTCDDCGEKLNFTTN